MRNRDDDLEDGRSREANRRYLEAADRRTLPGRGRWIPHRPWRATGWDDLMSVLGGIILLVIAGALLFGHFAR